jgi:putative PIN family toxin of toxin-antitoxin system
MRVVFDTVVFVRGLINPRGPCGRVIFDHARDFDLIVSPEIAAEYVEVLRRPEIARRFRQSSEGNILRVLDIISEATVVHPMTIPEICRDPADDKFLAAASESLASFIVTEDHDLLDIQVYRGIQIRTALAFLRGLAPGSEEEG